MKRILRKLLCSLGIHKRVIKFVLGNGGLRHVYFKKYVCHFCGKTKN